jgi:hypothetical protein
MANFGFESVGATWVTLVANSYIACKFSLPVDGTVSSITQYNGCDSGTPSVQYAIYDSSLNLKGNTGAYGLTTSYGWHTLDLVTPVFLSAGDYILVSCSNGTGYTKRTGSTGQSYYSSSGKTYGTWDNPATLGVASDSSMSIYATYTPGGATNVVYMTFES